MKLEISPKNIKRLSSALTIFIYSLTIMLAFTLISFSRMISGDKEEEYQ